MDNNNIEYLRHSAAHLLAQAISELYPNTLFTLGPATETGFFYDIINEDRNFKNEDLEIITNRMKEIVTKDIPIEHYYVPKNDAKKIFSENKYKLDIIENQIKEDVAGIAKQGDFLDLCKGGHVKSTGSLRHFLLTGISGSYWRGNREGEALQRISGIIFESKEALDSHLKQQADLEKYDHRRLGQEMDLFSFSDLGPGFPFIHPKGMIIINELIKYMRKITSENGYQEVRTPTILSSSLWKQSGHYSHYKENMYDIKIDNHECFVKPMNCPGMFLIFNTRPRSYREMPLRLSEFGHVHRHELSGTLHGLTRVRALTQDDAHIFCPVDEIENEIIRIMTLMDKAMINAGLNNMSILIETRPEKASGAIELWEKATDALKSALKKLNKEFKINEGDGAFYGPKISLSVKDLFGREWGCGTIQLDFIQPENFDLNFINKSGKKERLVVIHQAIYGSLERFMAILLEHHKGKLPFWLSPVQIKILSITDSQNEYVKEVCKYFIDNNYRTEININGDPLNAKIQDAIKEKASILIIIGKKEVESKTVSVRYIDGIQKNNIRIEEVLIGIDK